MGVSAVSLAILFLALLMQVYAWSRAHQSFDRKKIIVAFQILFIASLIVATFYYVYLIYTQYVVWQDSGPPTKYLVPPYKSITYVMGYYFIRFALYYAISSLMALLFLWSASHLNKKHEKRFFEDEEPYLGALSIFLLGNPMWNYAWIYYFVSLVGLYFLLHIFQVIRGVIVGRVRRAHVTMASTSERIPLYWLWLPLAILFIIIHTLLI